MLYIIHSDGTLRSPLAKTKFENPEIKDSDLINFEEGDQVQVKWRQETERDYLWYVYLYFRSDFRFINI